MNTRPKTEAIKEPEIKYETIFPAGSSLYTELREVWEKSVHATHHFLGETDFRFYQSEIEKQFSAVNIFCTRDTEGRVTAFVALSEEKIEMLFVHPNYHHKGLGSRLTDFAIRRFGICKVDVNEQNTSALAFYKRQGFVVMGRDAFDDAGRPYPILHLSL